MMEYVSTRAGASGEAVPSARAIAAGIAPDGGLYTPRSVPRLSGGDFERLAGLDYAGRAARILSLFLTDFTEDELLGYAHGAYSKERFRRPAGYPDGLSPVDGVALHRLSSAETVLELFWGPTCAFKDMALQILPHLLTASLRKTGEHRRACILVATSGDTGKAALEGFRDVDGTAVVVFYPEHGVSDVQKLQMVTQKGGNVGVCAVRGNFDDAQTGVKRIFTDPDVRALLDRQGFFLSSANSINWGRLAPQIVYYISAYCDLVRAGTVRAGEAINICVPTGNFGNILAAYLAKHMGLPVAKLLCASNANNVLTDFIRTGVYDRRRDFYTTLSPSMDILISSNVERLLYYLSGGDTAFVKSRMEALSRGGAYRLEGAPLDALRRDFYADFCGDDATRAAIRTVFEEDGYLIDTHTAVAVDVARRYRARTGDRTHTLIASTASAYKFGAGVLSALGGPADGDGLSLLDALHARTGVPVPEPLAALRGAQVRFGRTADRGGMADAVLALLGLSAK